MTRVYLHTFGCKANQYDTEVIRDALERCGVSTVDDPSLADTAVVNSCTVTHVSEKKMRRLVRRIARGNRDVNTVVIGCAATMDDGSIKALPGVGSVVGGTDPGKVLAAMGYVHSQTEEGLRSFERGTRAWLRIQDGCDEHCTYCATRLARGPSRSRLWNDLCREAEMLASKHDEIVLTGVHIGNYGSDLPVATSLGSLVEGLVDRVPNVRFRLSSVEATEIDDRIVGLMVDAPERLAPHVHAPLQSGSDRILRLMGRRWYTSMDYQRRLDRLSERLPRLGLGADVIVGFPGETEQDYASTHALIDALPLTYIHVFPYSPRPNVAAVKLGPPVPAPVTQRRSSELRALAEKKGLAYSAARNGERCDIVLLRRSRGCYEGLTEDYLSVKVSTNSELPSRLSAVLALRDGELWAEADHS